MKQAVRIDALKLLVKTMNDESLGIDKQLVAAEMVLRYTTADMPEVIPDETSEDAAV